MGFRLNFNKFIQLRVEGLIMMMRVREKDYALNPQMLRAVLNGYAIDMKVPCTLYSQDRGFKKMSEKEWLKMRYSDPNSNSKKLHDSASEDNRAN
mmetsp:Transcript_7407/g.12510  ORF Transcript_7407/g.12510 Transcript_7407/m.12510 type:complete len:95 (+) Transcript_7407:1084-1368(+)